MPKEYLKCVESEMNDGKSKDEAQKICAIAFYKRHGYSVNEAHKKGDFMEFAEHKSSQNPDGTFNILDVPIFELGKHRGVEYTEAWAKDALGNFSQLKQNKFLPRVIVGHTNDKDEKPAVGFLDNLKLAGKRVVADLVNLRKEVFEQIKAKAWPSRSVEVNPDKKKFTALALLGGTEPYFQFEPIDIKFQADPEGQWIEFGDPAYRSDRSIDDKKHLIEIIWDHMVEFFKQDKKQGEVNEMTPQELQQLKDQIKADFQKEFDTKFDDQYTKKFREQFGEDPAKFQEMLEKGKVEKFQEKKKSVLAAAKDRFRLAPAIVDGYFDPLIEAVNGHEAEPIKFAETQGNIFELMGKLAESIAKHADENTLIVGLDERAKFSGDENNPNLKQGNVSFALASEEELQQYHQEIRKLADKNKISYEDAAEQYLANKK